MIFLLQCGVLCYRKIDIYIFTKDSIRKTALKNPLASSRDNYSQDKTNYLNLNHHLRTIALSYTLLGAITTRCEHFKPCWPEVDVHDDFLRWTRKEKEEKLAQITVQAIQLLELTYVFREFALRVLTRNWTHINSRFPGPEFTLVRTRCTQIVV